MTILLIAPSYAYGEFESASSRVPHLGLAMIGAVLEREGFNVKILDMFALDMKIADVAREIRKIEPKVVGVTSVTANFLQAMNVLKAVKAIDNSITTIYGGPHVTIMPETAILSPYVDYIVIGEGEYTIVELINYILRGNGKRSQIKGIGYTNNGRMILTGMRPFIKDLDSLPMPAYHLLPMNAYRPYATLDVGRKFSSMITSRGCPFRCTYCTSSSIFGHMWRARNPKKVLEEIELLYNKYNVRHIFFQDDEFTINQNRTKEICNLLFKSGMDIIWECLTRVDSVNDELIQTMVEAGCRSIIYGVEAGYEGGLKKINKKITLNQAKNAIRWTKKHGIIAKATFIIGFPWESQVEIKKTINFAKELDADFTYFNMLTPYPGTELYGVIKKENLLVGGRDWKNYASHGSEPLIRTRYLTNKELSYWYGRAYLGCYLRPKFILKKLIQMRNLHYFIKSTKAGIALIVLSLKRFL